MKIFETHAHYDDKRYDGDRGEILSELAANGVDKVINIGADIKSSEASVALTERYDFIYCAVGVHPHSAKTLNEENFASLEKMTLSPKCVAVGEVGLDFHYDNSPRDVQRYWFVRQLELAARRRKPVIIHSREADDEVYGILKRSPCREGVIHCFSSDKELAAKYVQMGFYIGVGGVLTYKNTQMLREAVKNIDINHILLETDCPYLAPVPYRGQRNESKYLIYIAEELARVKNISPEEVARITYDNAVSLFGINVRRFTEKNET